MEREFSVEELVGWKELGIAAARIGGKILCEWASKFTAREKSQANLVTEADFASQEAIYEHISKVHPEHGFIGEEGLNKKGSTEFNWIIDPLDGTGNYVHGYPYYAVSIGLAYQNTLLAGVVYDPTRDECFHAYRGGGAFLNNRQIHVSKFKQIGDAFCIASLPQSRNENSPAIKRFLEVLKLAQTVQRTGSAALNLAYVAAGRVDAFWSSSLSPWDMSAGALMVLEAGGKVSSLHNGTYEVLGREILATNNQGFHEELSRILTSEG